MGLPSDSLGYHTGLQGSRIGVDECPWVPDISPWVSHWFRWVSMGLTLVARGLTTGGIAPFGVPW